jgi:hypothetical protein
MNQRAVFTLSILHVTVQSLSEIRGSENSAGSRRIVTTATPPPSIAAAARPEGIRDSNPVANTVFIFNC